VAISTYADLTAVISDWVERGDLATRIPTFIAAAEAKVNRWLRDRKTEAQDTASVDTALTALPDSFAEAITVQIRPNDAEPYARLDPAPADVVAGLDTAAGRPRIYAILGDQLMLHPPPDGPHTVLLTYFTKLPALSDANPTNWLLAEAPDVYLDGALASFHEFDQNWEAAGRYLQKFEGGLAELRAARRRPAGKLRVEAGLMTRAAYDILRDC
jgi:hypothetical protein